MSNKTDKSANSSGMFLSEIESKRILKQAGLRVTEPVLAKSREEAVSISRQIGFPVVLKIVSADITHKSDSGGVIVGLADAESVGKSYTGMMSVIRWKHPDAVIEGISVQKQAPPGV